MGKIVVVAPDPVTPVAPVTPMLARLARELPEGPGWTYEPKWDGFRALAFCEGGAVDIRSRHGRPFARYFPEVVAALAGIGDVVVDGELVVPSAAGGDFPALMARLHPAASRVERLARERPARFVAFDLVAADGRDWRSEPFTARRARLEAVVETAGDAVVLTPCTGDPAVARGWLEGAHGGGIDGVVAKPGDLRYQGGRRAMVKVKRERTADCVVPGFRLVPGERAVASLLLGLYDEGDGDDGAGTGAGGGDGGKLRFVGVASSFTASRREELFADLAPFAAPLVGHPWEKGFALEGGAIGRLAGAGGRWTPAMPLDWVPTRPVLVAEVGYDQLDGRRLRHPARFLRWRPDREATSCTHGQLKIPGSELAATVLDPARGAGHGEGAA